MSGESPSPSYRSGSFRIWLCSGLTFSYRNSLNIAFPYHPACCSPVGGADRVQRRRGFFRGGRRDFSDRAEKPSSSKAASVPMSGEWVLPVAHRSPGKRGGPPIIRRPMIAHPRPGRTGLPAKQRRSEQPLTSSSESPIRAERQWESPFWPTRHQRRSGFGRKYPMMLVSRRTAIWMWVRSRKPDVE